MENKKEFSFGSMELFTLIWSYRKHLIIVGLASVLFSAIFSGPMFITPMYESAVVFFPASTSSVSKALLDITPTKQDILQFGEEEQSEQMLQILNSDDIAGYIIRKYKLMEHYKIDSTGKYPITKLRKQYENNITFRKTEFNSVEIKVLDKDPQMAADIANDISARLDTVKHNIQRQRALEALKIVETEYKRKISQVQSMEDTLTKVRHKGVFDYKTQSEVFNQAYALAISSFENENAKLKVLSQFLSEKDTTYLNAKARMEGAAARMKGLENKMKNLADYGGKSLEMNGLLELEREQLTILKTKYNQAFIDATQNIPAKFIVNNAYKSEKPTYPIRSLIVAVCFIATELLAVVIIFILNLSRNSAKLEV